MMAVMAEFQLRKEHLSGINVNIVSLVSECIARPEIKLKLVRLISQIISAYPGVNLSFKTDCYKIIVQLDNHDIILCHISGFDYIFTDLEKNLDTLCNHDMIETLMKNLIEAALEIWVLRYFIGQCTLFHGDGGWMWYGEELLGKVGSIDTCLRIESGSTIRVNDSRTSFLSKVQSTRDILTGIVLYVNTIHYNHLIMYSYLKTHKLGNIKIIMRVQ